MISSPYKRGSRDKRTSGAEGIGPRAHRHTRFIRSRPLPLPEGESAIPLLEPSRLNRPHNAPQRRGKGKATSLRQIPLSGPAMLFFFAATVAFACVSAFALFAQAKPTSEYGIKAAFLYNFAKFVEWPPGVLASPKSPLTVCVFGADPFGAVLDDIVRGQTIDTHEIVTHRTNNLEELKACQIIFMSKLEIKYLSDLLDTLKGTSTLLVGEGPGFAEHGGAIQLYMEENKVHFSVNLEAVQRAHLTINSNLLAMAKIVRDGSPGMGN